MTEQIKRMEEEARKQLLHYHEKSISQAVKNIIKKAAGRYVPPKDLIFWPTGLLANTLMENYEECEDKEAVLTALITYFDRWIDKGMPIFYMDDILCGVALIDLYKLTGREKYKTAADKMAEFLYQMEEKEADQTGSLPYRPSQKNYYIYVDGIGMICPFLCKYGVEFGQERAIQTAVKQIRNMLSYGMDEKLMLPYHGYRYESKVKYGIIGWGRAVGWLLMGISGTLRFLPAEWEGCEELREMFSKVVESTASYQKENGAFSWQLETIEGPEDSSATAMIAQAVAEGLKSGILKGNTEMERCGYLIGRAADYIESCEKDGKIFHCSGECMGFSEYPQIYGAYPWSLGPGLNLLFAAGNLINDRR
ncbi:unsaturated rhamnogalacturonyl hydrolase [Kineothrix alysoides]|uniref:Unsaturated rhamnogalacturonyl hydrolase n=1 Tax=Kineothrix alysoides TaxID=1469948 RepID=A0A4R1R221_9FIRM|nr:glycoside hydrolase family 88 protein [Kineothrix alysoides]TCL59399.1 unsaturated rhamnogalacturonyl hydrolase [Kineothrix alysoides]